MASEPRRSLKVFLCHASGDKPAVRDLYKRLVAEGVDAWLDQEILLPGQDWRLEIPRAVHAADVVVICLSKNAITKEGYVQKEIKFALDLADEKPEGTIFLIPARLEDCVVPERLSRWHWVDLFEENGFIKLMRSLKSRADALGATVESDSYVDSDKERQRRLEQLYTEGLAAFYTEDWDRACHRFQTILSQQPNHKNATEKLAEAERQRDLAKLYEQAIEAYGGENWQAAIKILEELSQKAADYKDVGQLLKNARKQKRLKELYTEAKTLHAAQKWEAVLKVFEQISAIDTTYLDADGLLPSAQKEFAEIKRIAGLEDLYSRALREMDAGQWYNARGLLEQIHKLQTGFHATERLLRKVEDEIVRIEEQNKRANQVNVLYEQAHGLVRSKSWRKVLDKMEEIQKLDERFVDKDEIAKKAKEGLERDNQEAQKQDQLAAMYADAVRLLKEEKFQEAFDKWQEVRAIDPKYPDRQGVQNAAKKKFTGVQAAAGKGLKIQDEERIHSQEVVSSIPTQTHAGWLILIVAFSFGIGRYLIELLAQSTNFFGFGPNLWGFEILLGAFGVVSGIVMWFMFRFMKIRVTGKKVVVLLAGWTIGYSIIIVFGWQFNSASDPFWGWRLGSLLGGLIAGLGTSLMLLWLGIFHRAKQVTYVALGIAVLFPLTDVVFELFQNLLKGIPLILSVLQCFLVGLLSAWILAVQISPPAERINLAKQEWLLLSVFLATIIVRAIWGVIWFHTNNPGLPIFLPFLDLSVLGGLYGAIVAFSLRKIIHGLRLPHFLTVVIGWALGMGLVDIMGRFGWDWVAGMMLLGGLSVAGAIKWAEPKISWFKIALIFICWALVWKVGNTSGIFIKASFGNNDYIFCAVDGMTVLLGLLVTFGIYEYSSKRLVLLTILSMLGFAAGNLPNGLYEMFFDYRQLVVPIAIVILGFIGGISIELPSRDWKKILAHGGLGGLGLLLGYFASLLLLPGYMQEMWPERYVILRNMIWGVGLGLAFCLPSRRVSAIVLLALLGSSIFPLTSILNTTIFSELGNVWINIIRGGLIGLVLGFGYAYLTRENKSQQS